MSNGLEEQPAPRHFHRAPATGWDRWIPALELIRTYERPWLARDLVAGIALSALLVPAGMAYALASGLPAVTGLYATIVPLIVYAIVGPSRILIFGPDSSLTPLIAAVVIPLSGGDPARAIGYASALAIISGAFCFMAGLARFGFLAELLSAPVRYGYLNGIALLIFVSQLPRLFGFSVSGEQLAEVARGFAQGLRDGETNSWSLTFGLASAAFIYVSSRLAPRLPGIVGAVVLSSVAVAALGLGPDDLPLVGELPQGLPSFSLPGISWSEWTQLVGAAVGVAFVAFADASVLSQTYAIRSGREVDPNQELVALGVINVAAGLFTGFPGTSSQTRTPVAEFAGARTQLTGVFGALAVVAIILAAPGAFANLPSSVLAAVVMSAAVRLVAFRAVARLARVRQSEFILSMAAFASVAVLGPVLGVGAAIGFSLLYFMQRAWRPHTTELVRVDGMKGYHNIGRHPEGRRVPGLLLYRFDAPLFFANAAFFVQDVLRCVDTSPDQIRRVVITAEPVTDIDTTAANSLTQLLEELSLRGISVEFAELKGHVRERLESYGVAERVGAEHFHQTIGLAVRAYVAESGVDWVDWEDR